MTESDVNGIMYFMQEKDLTDMIGWDKIRDEAVANFPFLRKYLIACVEQELMAIAALSEMERWLDDNS